MSHNLFPMWGIWAGWAAIYFIALVVNAIQAICGQAVLATWHYVPFFFLCMIVLDAKRCEDNEKKKEKQTGRG